MVDLKDGCVVTRNGNGKLHMKQSIDLVKGGALSGASWGALWGLLIGFLFANPPIAFRLEDVESVEVVSSTWWERKFELPTVVIRGPGDQEMRVPKVGDATRFEAILLMLKKKAELGLPLHAPLPPDSAREGLKDWRP